MLLKFGLPLMALLLFFQNCGKVSMGVPLEETVLESSIEVPEIVPEPTPEPTPDPMLNCKLEKHLAIWSDPDKTGRIDNKNYLGAIYPYTGTLSAAANYNYYSASAHPFAGPVPREYSMAVFFYAEPNGDIYFTTFANVDDGASAAVNKWNLNVLTSKNNLLDKVVLSDDPGELKLVGTDKNSNAYQARFAYAKNTDGGVIGPFRGKNFQINAEILETGDIDNATFFSADGMGFDLRSSATSRVSSFIMQYQQYYICPTE